MSFVVEVEIFSPRWGRNDTYSITLDQNYIEIKMAPRVSKAVWRENQDPEWLGESIHTIMNNDHIYPPEVTQDLFEYLWKQWRAGEINNQQAENELREIANWINAITQHKPNTEFWNSYF